MNNWNGNPETSVDLRSRDAENPPAPAPSCGIADPLDRNCRNCGAHCNPDRKTRRDEYRGNPLLVLPMGEHREFSFGVGKARAILAHLDEIREFVAENANRQ